MLARALFLLTNFDVRHNITGQQNMQTIRSEKIAAGQKKRSRSSFF
jgi:hypothetical protein